MQGSQWAGDTGTDPLTREIFLPARLIQVASSGEFRGLKSDCPPPARALIGLVPHGHSLPVHPVPTCPRTKRRPLCPIPETPLRGGRAPKRSRSGTHTAWVWVVAELGPEPSPVASQDWPPVAASPALPVPKLRLCL